MFKVYKLISINSPYPLAEIRTDGKAVDIFVDNTNGKIAKKFKTFDQVLKYVKNSSILKLTQDHSPTVNLLRYILDNGDIVEITTDGHTVVLNNNLLSQEEKDGLFDAIKIGKIKVARKSDPSNPIPVFPTNFEKPVIADSTERKISKQMLEAVQKRQSELQQIRSLSTKSYDYEIENKDYSGAEDPEYCKKMLYALKYGDSNE
jgi:hypothetical protein